MKRLARFCLIAIAVAGCDFAAPALLHAAERPNVVIIISDDQGWADIGHNNPRVYSPNLDRLATTGAKLTQHYVMPQCTPTRIALMTGRYPGRFSRAGLQASNVPVFPRGTPTLAAMFQACGYETFMSGKWHLGSTAEYGPNHFGFDHSHGSLTGAVGMYDHRYHAKPDTPYDPTWRRDHEIIPGYENGTHVTDLTRDEAVKFIRQERDQPFFLYLPFHTPHLPLDERGPFVDTPTRPDPDDPQRWLNEDRIPWFNDPQGLIQAEPERDKRLLLAAVHHLDSAVGDVVQALEETGQREETIIFFSSDNGPWRDSNGGAYPDEIPLHDYNQPDHQRGKKLDVYEGGIHVPGFINWPAKIASRDIDAPVHIVDWFPTLAEIIDYQPEGDMLWDGVDLSPLLLSKTPLPQRDLYWIWNRTVNRWAVRLGRWKIVKYGRGEPQPAEWRLFDLEEDPEESNNVAADHPEIVADLHRRFVAQRRLDAEETFDETP